MTFAGTAGLFSPACGNARDLAVMFLSPWGLEEMCTRKLWRILAEQLSDIGIASLRFDYPSTANALDLPDSSGLEAWDRCIATAIDTLKTHSGSSRIVLLGQGLGASLALTAADDRPDIEGLALLAPVTKGRAYLRELMLWAKVVDDGLEVIDTLRDTSIGAIAGLTMPSGIAADVRKLDVSAPHLASAPHILVAARASRESDTALAAHLEAIGCTVSTIAYDSYDDLVSNPLISKMPDSIGPGLLQWIGGLPSFALVPTALPEPPAQPHPLQGQGFEEIPVRFGENDRLYGTMCRPTTGRSAATAVILSTAYDHQAGWGRSSVDLARHLARSGVSSLRFDSAAAGDSPPVPGRRAQILYDDVQMQDVAIARDFLQKIGDTEPALLVGRCSGAHLAFVSAVADDRWAGCVSINPFVFRWQSKPTEDVLATTPRAFEEYADKAMRLETFKRLLAGKIDIRNATRNVVISTARWVGRKLRPVLGSLLPQERWNQAVHGDFRVLRDRNTRLSVVFSARDQGLATFRFHFGNNGEKLRAYPNVRLDLIEDADHNLTPRPARERLNEIVTRSALELAGRG